MNSIIKALDRIAYALEQLVEILTKQVK
jgi:hypothetical protein